jgi:catechol 2,3-dioxygenase-like lactoylglutathione lyase family enzyme
MGRLHSVILLTPDIDRQRAFYAERLGLEAAPDGSVPTTFAMRGSSLVLRSQADGGAPEMRIALTTDALDQRVAALQSRSAPLDGGIVETELYRMAVLRDPEGNRVQLVEPREAQAEGSWPRLSHVIVSASKFDETVAFYHEMLGLKAVEEDERWVEFDTGPTRLAVHDREHADTIALHPDQKMAFALEDADFEAWVAELRERAVAFAAAPAEGELGPQAEVEDGDGWLVVLRGPAPAELPDEDELDAEYGEDDDGPHLMRRGGEMSSDGARRPAFNAAKTARKQAARTANKPAPAEPERGGFIPRPGMGGPRPFTPRPAGPGGFTPRPPREGGSFTPRPPREGGSFDRGPRPSGPRSDAPRPYPPRDSGPRPPRPSGPPRDRDRE